MPGWGEVRREAPEFADRVQAAFERNRHMTLATLRRDGSPRISGTEIEFDGGDLFVGMMPASRKARDLLCDPRIAIHGPTADPPEENRQKRDTVDIAWGVKVPTRTIGGLVYQHGLREALRSDLVIVQQENKLALNYLQ